jgi:IS30 family transposase
MRRIYDQLSIEERVVIQIRLELGIKPGAIALILNRLASTIWRELRRNGWARPKKCPNARTSFSGTGGYLADVAYRRARAHNAKLQVVNRLQPGTPYGIMSPVM